MKIRKILIVDTQPDWQEITKKVIRELPENHHEISCITADSALDGLRLVKKHPNADLVIIGTAISDKVTGINGFTLAQEMKHSPDERIRKMPIIFYLANPTTFTVAKTYTPYFVAKSVESLSGLGRLIGECLPQSE